MGILDGCRENVRRLLDLLLARRSCGRFSVAVDAAHVTTFISGDVEQKVLGGVVEEIPRPNEDIQFAREHSVRVDRLKGRGLIFHPITDMFVVFAVDLAVGGHAFPIALLPCKSGTWGAFVDAWFKRILQAVRAHPAVHFACFATDGDTYVVRASRSIIPADAVSTARP